MPLRVRRGGDSTFGVLRVTGEGATRVWQTWRMVMHPASAAEGFTRLTWEIEQAQGGLTKLTVIHELEGAPKLALLVSGAQEEFGAGGGWSWILSDLKTLLETGKGFNE